MEHKKRGKMLTRSSQQLGKSFPTLSGSREMERGRKQNLILGSQRERGKRKRGKTFQDEKRRGKIARDFYLDKRAGEG